MYSENIRTEKPIYLHLLYGGSVLRSQDGYETGSPLIILCNVSIGNVTGPKVNEQKNEGM